MSETQKEGKEEPGKWKGQTEFHWVECNLHVLAACLFLWAVI